MTKLTKHGIPSKKCGPKFTGNAKKLRTVKITDADYAVIVRSGGLAKLVRDGIELITGKSEAI
jgi:hypothetical protein